MPFAKEGLMLRYLFASRLSYYKTAPNISSAPSFVNIYIEHKNIYGIHFLIWKQRITKDRGNVLEVG